MKIQVNQQNFIKNLGAVFSDNTRFIGELIQNAVRAGATEIRFTAEDSILTAVDNGCGIDDFQNLLTLAESDWSDEVVKRDSPFGMGFLASLFVCEHIEVYSKSQSLIMDCNELLSGNEIAKPVASDWSEAGTCFRLLDVEDIDGAVDAIFHYTQSMPIQVFVNEKELERPHSIERATVDIEGIGKACIDLDNNGLDFTHAYVQGFQVYKEYYAYTKHEHQNIIHLDPELYQARMPDRDGLINQAANLTHIDAIWLELVVKPYLLSLIEKKDQVALDKVVLTKELERFLIQKGYIPKQYLYDQFEGNLTPTLFSGDRAVLSCASSGQFISDIESGNTLLISRDFLGDKLEQEDVQNRLEYLKKIGAKTDKKVLMLAKDTGTELDIQGLTPELTVTINNKKGEFKAIPYNTNDLTDNWNIKAIVADSFTMSSELGEVVIDNDSGLLLNDLDSLALGAEKGELYFIYTASSIKAQHLCFTVGRYWFGDNYDEFDRADFNHDMQDFETKLRKIFGQSPLEILEQTHRNHFETALGQAGVGEGDLVTLQIVNGSLQIKVA